MFVKFVAATQPDLAAMGFITQQSLGQSVTRSVDASRLKLSEPHKFLLCLRDLGGSGSEFTSSWLQHAYLSAMFLVLDDFVSEVVSTVGMTCSPHETRNRDYRLILASGNLLQWREAVNLGLTSQRQDVRAIFEKVQQELNGMNLKLWNTNQPKLR
jgi:hypothetical protein